MRIFILFILSFLVFFSIKKTHDQKAIIFPSSAQLEECEHDMLEKKAEPYKLFAQQRAYPNQSFDSDAWNNAMQKAKKQAQSSQTAFARGGNTPTPWTLEGPKNVPGRVNALALQPGASDTILAGFATGGIFRSTNGGLNWTAVFDEAEWCAIGDITFSPSHPNIVYASTGDPQLTGYTINGVGVFKSLDYGVTWEYAGFRDGGVLSTLIVHPTNPDILYVASMGNPFIRDNERGVYKSTDGGKNWSKQLNISNQAGCIDLVINNQNPNILYASFWDRLRNNTESLVWGPNAKVYKTSDGGQHWTQMTNGLPSGNNCRIGLAISQQNPDKVYAVYCDTTFHVGGLYKTINGGQTWVSQSIGGATNAYVGFGWYFSKLRLDPMNDEDIYLPGIVLYRKTPNGNSFAVEAGSHADTHDLVVAPNGKRYLATDGGPYYHEVGGSPSWKLAEDLPTTQFYKLGQKPSQPTWYYGGAQDNGTIGGPGNSTQRWYSYNSKDGFDCHFHPTDSNTYWMSSQNGEINLTSNGGQSWIYGVACLGSGDRCAWNTPFMLSPHDPLRLYAGTNRVHTSYGNQSLSWGAISQDLTDGNIYGNPFHVITCLDESILKKDKIFAGTSDGNVWYRAANSSFVNRSAGLPNRWVTSVKGSPTNVDRFYVTHSGLRSNENLSHIHRTDDNGATWVPISGDLPDLPVNDFLVLAGHADSILLAATDVGVYFTRNYGQNWFRLGNNLPYVPVYELEYNPRQNEVAAATFGRSIWSFPKDSILVQSTTPPPPEPDFYSVSGFLGDSLPPYTANASVWVGDSIFYMNGKYCFKNVLEGSNLSIKPFKNDDPLNGVNTFDLLLLQKHLLGVTPLTTTEKLLAADANNSGSLTPSDIIELRKLILGIYEDGLPKNNSWRFIPNSFVFSNPENPFLDTIPDAIVLQNIQQNYIAQNFKHIKIGDLDNSANMDSLHKIEDRNLPIIALSTEDLFFEKNEIKTIRFKADFTNIEACQLALYLDEKKVEILDCQPLTAWIKPENFYFLKEKNIVRFTNTDVKITTEEIFSLTLKTKKKGQLSKTLQFEKSDYCAPLAFSASGEKYRFRLDFGINHVMSVMGNFSPNPICHESSLTLPANFQGGTLNIYDLNGRLLLARELLPSDKTVRISRTDLASSSQVCFWKLGDWTGKILLQ